MPLPTECTLTDDALSWMDGAEPWRAYRVGATLYVERAGAVIASCPTETAWRDLSGRILMALCRALLHIGYKAPVMRSLDATSAYAELSTHYADYSIDGVFDTARLQPGEAVRWRAVALVPLRWIGWVHDVAQVVTGAAGAHVVEWGDPAGAVDDDLLVMGGNAAEWTARADTANPGAVVVSRVPWVVVCDASTLDVFYMALMTIPEVES